MLFSEAKGRKIVSTSNADTVGKVDGFVVDPAKQAVVALEVKKTDSGDTLEWSSINGFGSDAVTVKDADTFIEKDAGIEALSGKKHKFVGATVLSDAGDELGEVDDVDFDAASGSIVSILLKGDDKVEGSRLVGIGSYAVVVKA